MDINLVNTTGARSVLTKLNNKLKNLCNGELSIALYPYLDKPITTDILNMTYDKNIQSDFIICLNYGGECISSISCKINRENHYVEFSSKTQDIYEGSKYNLLTRSALILLCPNITYNGRERITSIISKAVNPTSIYLMAKYFYADNENLNEYMDDNGLTNDTLTHYHAKEFYDNIDSYDLDEYDEEEDEEKMAERLKNDKNFGNPVKLVIDLTNNMYIDRANEILNTISIKCPKKGGTKNKNKNKCSKKRNRNKRTKKYNKK
jgi:hypothetical protein